MGFNIEIKARCADPEHIKQVLEAHNAEYKGLDHQIDTYYHTQQGRLKIRRGNIENCLVFYEREDQEGPKGSSVILVRGQLDDLHIVLEKTCGVRKVVDKHRHIYFIGNVKFHIDSVEGLGDFCEIEAIDKDGDIGEECLQVQCDQYIKLLGIRPEDLIAQSYSDML